MSSKTSQRHEQDDEVAHSHADGANVEWIVEFLQVLDDHCDYVDVENNEQACQHCDEILQPHGHRPHITGWSGEQFSQDSPIRANGRQRTVRTAHGGKGKLKVIVPD